MSISYARDISLSDTDLFKGFAAKASESAIEAIHALESKYMPNIEQDITFSAQDA